MSSVPEECVRPDFIRGLREREGASTLSNNMQLMLKNWSVKVHYFLCKIRSVLHDLRYLKIAFMEYDNNHIFLRSNWREITHSNSRLMDCSSQSNDCCCLEGIVCFLVAFLGHTSPSISVSSSVKCFLSQLPITIHWSQARNSPLVSSVGQNEIQKNGLTQLDCQSVFQSFIRIWITVTTYNHHRSCHKGKV